MSARRKTLQFLLKLNFVAIRGCRLESSHVADSGATKSKEFILGG